MSKRVVVTGIGCVSSLGDSVKEMEQNLTMGRSGYREIPVPLRRKGLHPDASARPEKH